MANGFQGQIGQQVPEMTESWVNQISERYIELYENIIGEKFVRPDVSNVLSRVEKNVKQWIIDNDPILPSTN
jgi:phosphoribosylaminoimidazole-succinocarboxamide synthase